MRWGSFAGGMAGGLESGYRTGLWGKQQQREDERWGLEKRTKTLEAERAESAAQAEKAMNEAGFKVFNAWKMSGGAESGPGLPSEPEYQAQGGKPPPFELMLRVSDARMFAAMDSKRPDLAVAEASKGMALREANIQNLYTEADRDFAISGDLNAYTRAVNKLYPGTNLQATQNPDGSVRLHGTRLGTATDETVTADQLQRRIQMAFDPKTVRAQIAQMALKRAESNLRREEKAPELAINERRAAAAERSAEANERRAAAYEGLMGERQRNLAGGLTEQGADPNRPRGGIGAGGETADQRNRRTRYEMLVPLYGEDKAKAIAYGNEKLPSSFDVNKAAERIVADMEKQIIRDSERKEFIKNRKATLEEVKQRLLGDSRQAGQSSSPGLGDSGVRSRFEKDAAIPKGATLGPKTDKGYEVRDAAGKLIGHYE